MTPFRVMLALVLVMVAVLLAAGCENQDYLEPSHEVIVGKLNNDGTQAWTMTINDSVDNVASDIIQLSDGNFAVTGSIKHEQCKPHFEQCQNFPRIILISNDGKVIQWNLSSDDDILERQASKNLKSDISWMQSNRDPNIEEIQSIIKMEGGQGYLATGYAAGASINDMFLFRIDSEGHLLNKTLIDHAIQRSKMTFKTFDNGYEIQFSKDFINNGGYIYSRLNEIYLTQEGSVVNKRVLDIPITYMMTSSGDYIFMGFLKPEIEANRYADAMSKTDSGQINDAFHIVKRSSDGNTTVWDTIITHAFADKPIKIIQTSEGGFAFLAIRNK